MKTKSTILEIFYGNIGTYDTVKISDKYKDLLEKVATQDELLRKNLQPYPNLLEQYTKTNELIDQMYAECNDIHYLEGFKIGLLVGIEARDR